MEFRLFIDEPSLVWKAQRGALRANGALLREIAAPCMAMAILFALLYGPMDRRFGHRAPVAGETTVMTARTDAAPRIAGIMVETPGVRIPRTGEVSWRIRLLHAGRVSVPPGVEVRYPRSDLWLLWFFATSSVSALVLAKAL